MATIEDKEKSIRDAFSNEDYDIEVTSYEDAHNRNLVHRVTAADDDRRSKEVRSSFDEPLGQEKLDWLVGSFPHAREEPEGEEADEVFGDTADVE